MSHKPSEVVANRDGALPVITFTTEDGKSSPDSSSESKRARFRRSLSSEALQSKVKQLHQTHQEKLNSSPGKPGLQDRLFNTILEQIIPSVQLDEDDEVMMKVDRRSSEYVRRPAFSLTTMSNNFRRFNARIGIVFVFQNQMIRLFSWKTTSHTLSFLAIYTFVCLDPYLLIVLPLAAALLFIMVPAFQTRHPPSKPSGRPQNSYDAYSGPPIAPAAIIKPAAETSKDFFRNMRDLQNSMADFSNIHDVLVTTVAPVTNFSDEVLSSTVFINLALITCILFVATHLLPIRATMLVAGYAMTISGHPSAQEWLENQKKTIEVQTLEFADPDVTQKKLKILNIPIPNNRVFRGLQTALAAMSEITLQAAPQTHEIEVFELQHRSLLPAGTSEDSAKSTRTPILEWQHHIYTPYPYDPLSPHRISGSRPHGTRFFEDVRPPPGYVFSTPKWQLDLEAGEWVQERMITGVEYDLLHHSRDNDNDNGDVTGGNLADMLARRESVNADFGGWVWDLPPPNDETKTGLDRDDEVWLAYGDYNLEALGEREAEKATKKKPDQEKQKKDWEEQIRFGSRGRTGEWRRRRWVRRVKRSENLSKEEKR